MVLEGKVGTDIARLSIYRVFVVGGSLISDCIVGLLYGLNDEALALYLAIHELVEDVLLETQCRLISPLARVDRFILVLVLIEILDLLEVALDLRVSLQLIEFPRAGNL